jgi:hypothetical protein
MSVACFMGASVGEGWGQGFNSEIVRALQACSHTYGVKSQGRGGKAQMCSNQGCRVSGGQIPEALLNDV